MAGEALAAGTSAVLGTVLAVAGTAFVMWNSTATERTKFLTQIEALNTKVDKTSAAIADLTKTPAAGGPEAALNALSAKLDATNKSLAALTAKIEATEKTLTDIKSASGGVGDLKAATTAQEQVLQRIAVSVDSIKVTTEAQKAALAALSTPTSTAAKDTSQMEATRAAPERELVVVYMPQTAGPAAAAPAGLSVRFDRSANANTQTQKLAADLKTFIGERKNCVVTVAGYADTLGSDKVNLAVSRERAQIVANGLRSALPGVEVKEVAWGERNLAVWTPDNKIEMANRRVDVNVECK